MKAGESFSCAGFSRQLGKPLLCVNTWRAVMRSISGCAASQSGRNTSTSGASMSSTPSSASFSTSQANAGLLSDAASNTASVVSGRESLARATPAAWVWIWPACTRAKATPGTPQARIRRGRSARKPASGHHAGEAGVAFAFTASGRAAQALVSAGSAANRAVRCRKCRREQAGAFMCSSCQQRVTVRHAAGKHHIHASGKSPLRRRD